MPPMGEVVECCGGEFLAEAGDGVVIFEMLVERGLGDAKQKAEDGNPLVRRQGEVGDFSGAGEGVAEGEEFRPLRSGN